MNEKLKQIEEDNKITIRFDVERLKRNFLAFSKFGKVYYPLKSNSEEALLKELLPLLNNNENGFAIKTWGHYQKLRTLGVAAERINLIDVLAESSLVRGLYDEGVRDFTFDSLESLTEFASYADLSKCKIHVRLNINEVFKGILPNDEVIHLGGSVQTTQAMCQFLKEHKCSNFGISFYLQKELNNTPNALSKMMDFIADNYNAYGLTFVNIGGSKTPEELNAISPKLEDIKQRLNLQYILLEPGRYLAGNTMDMVSKIIKTSEIQGREIVVMKNGIYSGLLDEKLYKKQFDMYLEDENGVQTRIERNKTETATHGFMLVGGSSDSGDRIGICYVPEEKAYLLKQKTNIIIKDVGTYCMEFKMQLGGDINYRFVTQNQGKEKA